jgi:hypothetical protein
METKTFEDRNGETILWLEPQDIAVLPSSITQHLDKSGAQGLSATTLDKSTSSAIVAECDKMYEDAMWSQRKHDMTIAAELYCLVRPYCDEDFGTFEIDRFVEVNN